MPEIFLGLHTNRTNNQPEEVNRNNVNNVGQGRTRGNDGEVTEIPDPEPYDPIIIISAMDMANCGIIGTAFCLEDMLDEIMVAMERLANGQISISQLQQDQMAKSQMARTVKAGRREIKSIDKGKDLPFMKNVGSTFSICTGSASIIACVVVGIGASAFPPLLILGIAGGAVSIFMGVDGIVANETGSGMIGHALKLTPMSDEAAMWTEMGIKILIMIAMLGASAHLAGAQAATCLKESASVIMAISNMVGDQASLVNISLTAYQTANKFEATMIEVRAKRDKSKADLLAEIVEQLARLVEILVKLLKSLSDRQTNTIEASVDLAKAIRHPQLVG